MNQPFLSHITKLTYKTSIIYNHVFFSNYHPLPCLVWCIVVHILPPVDDWNSVKAYVGLFITSHTCKHEEPLINTLSRLRMCHSVLLNLSLLSTRGARRGSIKNLRLTLFTKFESYTFPCRWRGVSTKQQEVNCGAWKSAHAPTAPPEKIKILNI